MLKQETKAINWVRRINCPKSGEFGKELHVVRRSSQYFAKIFDLES